MDGVRMADLRAECRAMGIRPAKSKAKTLSRIKQARIVREMLRVTHAKFYRAVLRPSPFEVAPFHSGTLRIRIPADA